MAGWTTPSGNSTPSPPIEGFEATIRNLRIRSRLHRGRGCVLMAGESEVTIDREERNGLYELIRQEQI